MYEAAYPDEDVSAFAALGCDTAQLIMAAVAKAGSADPPVVLEALPTLGEFRCNRHYQLRRRQPNTHQIRFRYRLTAAGLHWASRNLPCPAYPNRKFHPLFKPRLSE
ncbi:MAG: hypothetical protein R3C44_15565 [Chloroflexota bacterium]